jgi:DNA repair exonuclease SbcCD ATPase subunit
MYFGLGFLVAGLIALLIVPAVNARAERLARRRLEALFPLSISELTAEKDHLRAEFAVLQRRLERKAEEALANKHQDMEELGRRAVRIEALEGEIAARDHRIGELEGDLERMRAQLTSGDAELSATRHALAASQETQTALDTAHRRIVDELGSTRGNLEITTAALAEARTALAAAEEKLTRREAEFADLDTRHGVTSGELDARRIAISDLDMRLSTQKSRADELEHALAERRSELAEEQSRAAELAHQLAAEKALAASLEERVRTLDAENEGRAALQAQADEHRSAFDLAAAKLVEAEARIAELEASLQRHADGAGASSGGDSAELRRRIEEVADEIMRVTDGAVEEEPKRSRSAG